MSAGKSFPIRVLRRTMFNLLVRVHPGPPLIRLGSNYGGWTIAPSLLGPDSVCYCAGVGEDITFDMALIDRFRCTVHAFDPTPRAIDFVDQQKPDSRFHFHPIGVWSSQGTLRFYAPRDPLHVSHSVVNLQRTDDYFTAECESIPDLMKRLGHEKVTLLKLDVEGAEHAALGPALSMRPLIPTICVEFDQPSRLVAVLKTCRRLRHAGYRLVARRGWDCTFLLTTGDSGRRLSSRLIQ